MLEAVLTALVAGFSPWTLLIVAGLLGRPRPLRPALVFLAAAAVVTLLVGFLVVQGLGASGLENRQRHRTVSPAIDLGLGLAILAFVPYLAHRAAHPGEQKTKKTRKSKPGKRTSRLRLRRRDEAGLLAIAALGAFAGAPSPLYLASLHSVSKARPGALVSTFDVLLIAALVLFMAEVPILLYLAAPDRTIAQLDTANTWLARHGRVLVACGATAAGCYFTVLGLVHLLQ